VQKWSCLQQTVWNLVHGRVRCILASKMFSWFCMKTMQAVKIVGPATIKMENVFILLHYWLQHLDLYLVCILPKTMWVHWWHQGLLLYTNVLSWSICNFEVLLEISKNNSFVAQIWRMPPMQLKRWRFSITFVKGFCCS
jgi:hypothetical protein